MFFILYSGHKWLDHIVEIDYLPKIFIPISFLLQLYYNCIIVAVTGRISEKQLKTACVKLS